MPYRPAAVACLGLLFALAASSERTPTLPHATRPLATPGAARLQVFGSRSAEQQQSGVGRKLDATLAELTRSSGSIRPEHALSDLHALNPAVRFTQRAAGAEPLVAIDATARGRPAQLQAALQKLGLQNGAVYRNDVGGWLPLSAIDAATALSELHSMRAALSHRRAGAVTSQGDFAQGSAALRSTYTTLTGSSITVGVLSDSFNCYAVYGALGSMVPASGPNGYAPNGFVVTAQQDEASGDLPASVNVIEEAECSSYGAPDFLPLTDEGRAMLQIVHDVAPGAALAFYTANDSEADFAAGIGKLAAAGAMIEADDTGYYDEPFFQDGIVAEAIDAVQSQGVAYFSAAGNDAEFSYENAAPSFATQSGSGPTAGDLLLNFDTSGNTTATALPISLPSLQPGEFVALVVEWDQPYVTGAPGSGGASSQIDLCVTGSAGSDLILGAGSNGCTGLNGVGVDPVQILIVGNPASATENSAPVSLNVIIALAAGGPVPGRVKLALEGDGAPVAIDAYATHSGTIQGHPGAAGAIAVGAAFFADTPNCGVSPAMLEPYSSEGGTPILFNSSGDRLATPLLRQKPDVVGPDGVNTTFFGYPLSDGLATDSSKVAQCANDASYPNFFGTSAATPHVAAGAALLMQSNPTITAAQVYQALRVSAAPMDATVPDDIAGFGFVQIGAALGQLPLPSPTLSLAASSVALGGSTKISWSSINATSCTASGSWSGGMAVNGSATVTPAAVGAASYTLTCANAVSSAARTVGLNVTAAAASHSSGGGGGGLGGGTLIALAALAAARMLKVRPLTPPPAPLHSPRRSRHRARPATGAHA
jgi:subtilase family protein